MSQALQSLNNILKYRLERERQKIGESLSMLELGTKLRQQDYDNKLQDKMMDFRIAQEKRAAAKENRDIEIANVQLKAAQLELDKFQRQESPENIELNRRLKEAQVQEYETKTKVSEEEFEAYQQKRTDEAYAKVEASIETLQKDKAEKIVEGWKQNNLIPPVVFQEVRKLITDDEFSLEDFTTVKKEIKDRLGEGLFTDDKSTKKQLDYVKELLDDRKYGDLILSGIASSEMNAKLKGESDYQPLLEILDELSGTMANDIELKKKLENYGVPHQTLLAGLYQVGINEKNKEIIEEAKMSGAFQASLNRLMKEKVNLEMEEVAKILAGQTGLRYITNWEKQQLISQGIDPSELE